MAFSRQIPRAPGNASRSVARKTEILAPLCQSESRASSQIMQSLEQLRLELEDVQEDLKGIPLNTPDIRVGDFGCGQGYTTLSLMLVLHAAECFGIDKFSGQMLSPSLQEVQRRFDEIKSTVLSSLDDSSIDSLSKEILILLNNNRWPLFRQNDILKGSDLPNDLDLVYCKRLLGPIYDGEDGNPIRGDAAVKLAIDNIAGSIRNGGLFCLVERSAKDFSLYLEQAHLAYLRICHIRYGDIGLQGRLTSSSGICHYVVYFYKKT